MAQEGVNIDPGSLTSQLPGLALTLTTAAAGRLTVASSPLRDSPVGTKARAEE